MTITTTQSVDQETDMIVDDSEIVSLLKGPGKSRAIPEPYRGRIVSSIFSPPDGPKEPFGVFAIMEGAHAPQLYAMLLAHAVELHHELTPEQMAAEGKRAVDEGKPTFCGLPRGLLLAERRMESPYVIHFREQCTLSNWLIDEGWGQGWVFWGWANMAAAGKRAMPSAQALADSSLPSSGLGLRTREAHSPALQTNIGDPTNPMPQALVHVLSRHFRKFGMVELQESEDAKPRTV